MVTLSPLRADLNPLRHFAGRLNLPFASRWSTVRLAGFGGLSGGKLAGCVPRYFVVVDPDLVMAPVWLFCAAGVVRCGCSATLCALCRRFAGIQQFRSTLPPAGLSGAFPLPCAAGLPRRASRSRRTAIPRQPQQPEGASCLPEVRSRAPVQPAAWRIASAAAAARERGGATFSGGACYPRSTRGFC